MLDDFVELAVSQVLTLQPLVGRLHLGLVKAGATQRNRLAHRQATIHRVLEDVARQSAQRQALGAKARIQRDAHLLQAGRVGDAGIAEELGGIEDRAASGADVADGALGPGLLWCCSQQLLCSQGRNAKVLCSSQAVVPVDHIGLAVSWVGPDLNDALGIGVPLRHPLEGVAALPALRINAFLELEALRVHGDVTHWQQGLACPEPVGDDGAALLLQQAQAVDHVLAGELLKLTARQALDGSKQVRAAAGMGDSQQLGVAQRLPLIGVGRDRLGKVLAWRSSRRGADHRVGLRRSLLSHELLHLGQDRAVNLIQGFQRLVVQAVDAHRCDVNLRHVFRIPGVSPGVCRARQVASHHRTFCRHRLGRDFSRSRSSCLRGRSGLGLRAEQFFRRLLVGLGRCRLRLLGEAVFAGVCIHLLDAVVDGLLARGLSFRLDAALPEVAGHVWRNLGELDGSRCQATDKAAKQHVARDALERSADPVVLARLHRQGASAGDAHGLQQVAAVALGLIDKQAAYCGINAKVQGPAQRLASQARSTDGNRQGRGQGGQCGVDGEASRQVGEPALLVRRHLLAPPGAHGRRSVLLKAHQGPADWSALRVSRLEGLAAENTLSQVDACKRGIDRGLDQPGMSDLTCCRS